MTIVPLLSTGAALNSNPASTAVCEPDLHRICGLESFPTETADIYQARMCLRANSDFIDASCVNYLTVTNPSIVEPCFAEINVYCKYVPAGDSRVHHCLEAVIPHLSAKCADVVKSEMEDSMSSSFVNVYDDGDNDDDYEEQPDLSSAEQIRAGLTDLSFTRNELKNIAKTPALSPLSEMFAHIGSQLELLQIVVLNLLNTNEWPASLSIDLSSTDSSSSSYTYLSSLSSYSYFYYGTSEESSSQSASSSSSLSGFRSVNDELLPCHRALRYV